MITDHMKKLIGIARLCLFSFVVAMIFALLLDRALIFLPVPLTRASHPPNYEIKVHQQEFSYVFRTNSQGIRYPEIPLEKSSLEDRVLVLGDSFVEGFGVAEDKTFSHILEERISSEQGRPVRFINMGLSGTGPLEYERILNAVGYKYQPDGVLICLYANDLQNIKRTEASEKKRKYYLVRLLYPEIYKRLLLVLEKLHKHFQPERDWKALTLNKADAMRISREEIETWKKSIPEDIWKAADEEMIPRASITFGLVRKNHWVDALDIESAESQDKWKEMEKIMERMIAGIRAKGLKVFVVYFPCRAQYDPSLYDEKTLSLFLLSGVEHRRRWLSETTAIERNLQEMTERLEVPFLNLLPIIRSAPMEKISLIHPVDEHWNEQGHLFAADAIKRWLEPFLDLEGARH